MAKELPSSPIKAKTSAFLHRLKRAKSGNLGPAAVCVEGSETGAAGSSPPVEPRPVAGLDKGSSASLEQRTAGISLVETMPSLPGRAGSSSNVLSGVSISTSPFLGSSGTFAEPPATPPDAAAMASLRVQTGAGPTNVDPADISLPLPSPSEEDALTLTDVVELQAFVEKKRWIEQQIVVLRALEPVDCFAGCRLTFAREDDSDAGAGSGALPTKDEVNAMFREHERIEAEAEQLDGGEIARLRQMAKAASQKSLSRGDTDLLDITLSTLFLLDTLLHLLRDRADTLDLLALRLDWDARRLDIAHDVGSVERDVRAFVEGKGRWSLDAYRRPTEGPAGAEADVANGARARLARRGSDASIKSVSSAKSFGAGGNTASRSQRFLMTQIMELDCQSFQNRISSLRGGPVAQAGRILDRMIDVAASIRSRNKKRAAHEVASAKVDGEHGFVAGAEAADADQANAAADDPAGGALPEWFLDEMDRVELEVDQLRAWDDLARAHTRQWKLADQIYHTSRKTQADAEALVFDITQAFLQPPSLERAALFDTKAGHLASSVSLVGDLKSHPTLSLPPALFAAATPALGLPDSAIVDLLSGEVSSSKAAAETALDEASGYRRLAERTSKLDGLRTAMEALDVELAASADQLERGFPDEPSGDVPDLSSIACLDPGAHSAFLSRLPAVSSAVEAACARSAAVVGESTALLMALKASGMDPNFRSSVQATNARLQASQARAAAASMTAVLLANKLAAYQKVAVAHGEAASRAATLGSDLLAALEQTRWTPLRATSPSSSDPPPSASDQDVASLAAFVTSDCLEPMASLSDGMREKHPQIFAHLTDASLRLVSTVGALRELSNRLLPAVTHQRQSVEQLTARSTRLLAAGAKAQTSLARLPKAPSDLGQLVAKIEAFLSALAEDVPFVSSPSLAAALAFNTPSAPADPLDLVPTTTAVWPAPLDLERLDASVRTHVNAVAADLIRERELLRAGAARVPIARFQQGVESVDAALSKVLDLTDAVQAAPGSLGDASSARRADLQFELDALSSAFSSLSRTASSLQNRAEAQAEIARLKQAVDEMTDMAAAVLHPSQQRSRSASVASSCTSDGGLSGNDDDDGRTSIASVTTASNAHASHAAAPDMASSSTTSLHARTVTTNGGTPTKISSLTKSSRPRLPTSMLALPPGGSPWSVSGPAGGIESTPRSTVDSPRGISNLSARQRTISGASSSSSGRIATPSRLRYPSQPSDFLSPSIVHSPSAEGTLTLPRAVRYRSPAPSSATGAAPDRRGHLQADGLTRTRERAVSAASADDAALATPTRRSVSAAAVRTPNSRRPYVAQKGHKLDRAVGKIVNAMPVEIPIVAAHEGADTETGRYWIGEPPKLCFCRILRSRTVMVRVGGGWVELSKFLRDHFKDMIPAASPTSMLSPAQPGERWIAGGGPSTPSRTPGAPALAPIAGSPAVTRHATPGSHDEAPATPEHGGSVPRRARKVSGAPPTPSFSTPRSMTVLVSSPADGAALGSPGSPGSPLVPLQLMRKAGDGERSSPGSLSSAAASLGLGTPSSVPRTAGRSVSSTSTSSARSRPSIPWRF